MSNSTLTSSYTDGSDHIKSKEGAINTKIEEEDVIIKKEEYIEDNHTQKRVLKAKTLSISRKGPAKLRPIAGVKNVVKNYGKAMCSFACSDIAVQFLPSILEAEKIKLQGFIAYVQNHKEHVDSIESLRTVLLATEQDSEEVASYKRAFQKLSIVFLKDFCINWIYSGKLTHRQTHLSFRHKMLRRVRNPEMFTYLQNPPKKKIL